MESFRFHYIRNNTLMSNEELGERARVYVRENAAPRGRPNLTAGAFCQWVNNQLPPNSVLEPGYPRRVSVETARKWLYDLEFDVLQLSKGVFIDGHDRPDVVESRVKFLPGQLKAPLVQHVTFSDLLHSRPLPSAHR